MTPYARKIEAAIALGLLGILALAIPWLWLFTNSKSPLQLHGDGNTGAFLAGVDFAFFQMVGLGLIAGASRAYRRRFASRGKF